MTLFTAFTPSFKKFCTLSFTLSQPCGLVQVQKKKIRSAKKKKNLNFRTEIFIPEISRTENSYSWEKFPTFPISILYLIDYQIIPSPVSPVRRNFCSDTVPVT